MKQGNNKKIKLFIGSSGKEEAKKVVRDVESALREIQIPNYEIEYESWCYSRFFKQGHYTLDSLIKELEVADAAIFIYNGDDELIKNRKKMKVPRNNVIFEHGLFVGYLGKEKTFVLLTGGKDGEDTEKRMKQTPDINIVLSDYSGITRFDYSEVEYRSSALIDELQDWIKNTIISKAEVFKTEDFKITASIVETHGPNDNRDGEFTELYREAKKGDSIKVLGLGVTSFLNGDYIDDLLEQGVNITVLLMHDKIIKNDGDCELEKLIKELPSIKLSSKDDSCPVTIRNILINKNHFNDYQHRQENSVYLAKMYHAYDNCKKYQSNYPELFKFYYFYSFIPMSMTAFQKNGEKRKGKLIVEFIIPFTKNRILLKVSEEENKIIFDTFMSFYDNIENQSKKHNN